MVRSDGEGAATIVIDEAHRLELEKLEVTLALFVADDFVIVGTFSMRVRTESFTLTCEMDVPIVWPSITT